jgi:hypothetical protein
MCLRGLLRVPRLVSIDEEPVAHLLSAGAALLQLRAERLPALCGVVEIRRACELLLGALALLGARGAVLLHFGEPLEITGCAAVPVHVVLELVGAALGLVREVLELDTLEQ